MKHFLQLLCIVLASALQAQPLVLQIDSSTSEINRSFTVPSGKAITFASGSTLTMPTGGTLSLFGSSITTLAGLRTAIGAGTGSGDLLAANNLSDVASASTARTNLGLTIGTNVQAYDADLTTYAGITPSANVQTLLGSADYAAFRTSLGAGPVINVKAAAYGAVGDGSTNDTAAIQAAIDAADAANVSTVYFPPGVYKCNITVPGWINLRGEANVGSVEGFNGANSVTNVSTLTPQTNTSPVITITQCLGQQIHNLRIQGPGAYTASSTGISVRTGGGNFAGTGLQLFGVEVRDFEKGVNLQANRTVAMHSSFVGCGYGIYADTTSDGYPIDTSTFINCSFGGSKETSAGVRQGAGSRTNYGCYIKSYARSVTFSACEMGQTGTALYLAIGGQVLIAGSNFEDCDTGAIFVDDGYVTLQNSQHAGSTPWVHLAGASGTGVGVVRFENCYDAGSYGSIVRAQTSVPVINVTANCKQSLQIDNVNDSLTHVSYTPVKEIAGLGALTGWVYSTAGVLSADTTPAINLSDATGLALSTGVTGTLPVGNGGTGQTSAQAAVNALMAASGALSQGDVFYFNGTNVVRLAAGTSGYFLKTNGAGANPAWAAAAGDVATDAIFDAKGDLAVGTGANTSAKLSVGTNGQVLTADSGETTGVKWSTVSGSGDVIAAGTNSFTGLNTFTAEASGATTGTVGISNNGNTGYSLVVDTVDVEAFTNTKVARFALNGTDALNITGNDVTVGGNLVVNTSLTVGGVAVPTISSTSTLTNKTLTSPAIGTAILDTGGNELFKFTATGSAVNEVTLANAATGSGPTLSATGGDTNIDLNITAKGTGAVKIPGYARLLDRSTSTVTVVSSNAETTLYSFAIPANTIGATGTLRLRMIGDYLNNSGAGRTFTLKVKLGSTTLWADTSSSFAAGATRRTFTIEGTIQNTATNAQLLDGALRINGVAAATNGLGPLDAVGLIYPFSGTGAEDTTGSKTLDVTITHSASDADLSARCFSATLELVP